jgi:hypothetical protein
MALGGKTVQYTLAVNMETGQLTAEAKNVSAQIGQIKAQTAGANGGMLEFAKGIKQLKGELSLLFLGSFGGYALAMGLLSDALSFAAGKAKEFMVGIKFDPKVLEDLREYVSGLEKAGMAQSNIIDLRIADLKSQIAINEAQNKTNEAARSVVGLGLGGGGVNVPALIDGVKNYMTAKNQETAVINENTKAQKDQYQILEGLELARAAVAARENADKYIENEKKKTENQKKQTAEYLEAQRALAKELAEIEALHRNDIESIENTKIAAKTMSGKQELDIAIDVGKRKQQYLQNELDFYFAAEEERINKLEQTEIAIQQMKDQIAGIAFQGLVDGFNAVGAALVTGQDAFKSFGSVFIKTLGMLATQLGTFLIAVGVGMSTVPELFGFGKGAAAVAAGTALVVLGGALGALSGKIGGSGGGYRGGDREQRFRDSNFNTSGGNGGTTIINNINFANTIGLTRDSMKEVGEVISAELFKQGKLGRIETVG